MAAHMLLEEQIKTRGAVPSDDEPARREAEEKERRRRRRAGPSRESVRARPKEELRASEMGDSADKFITQASEIGQSVFSRATSLWNTGKEKAVKAFEEQRKALDAERTNRETRNDGRPRWMVDDAEAGDRPGEEIPQENGFRDDDEEEDPMPRPNGKSRRAEKFERPARRTQREELIFDGRDEPKAKSIAPRPMGKAAPPPRPATPLIRRELVSASPSQISAAATHRTAGNDHFKLGRFPEAEAAYSRGISALPHGHLLLIPLHNNRAATRLKAGDSAAAMSDSNIVINLIGLNYHPAKEHPLPADLASEVKVGDALVKAMIKRAKAAEMAEKWSAAVEDWERIAGLDAVILGKTSASTRNLALEGCRRSRRMLAGPEQPPQKAGSRSKPPATSRPSRPADVAKSEAVAELRKVAAANEAEDAQRMLLKDLVDARVNSWKNSKEDNLRALIASLDSVLWDEILSGGLKVGMHELIQDKQVKIKYMKVIARLHPDKASVGINRG